jgi:transcriptional antiterminator RfaH
MPDRGQTGGWWTVARTHPNSEAKAILNLQRQGFEYYQPRILEKKLRKQKLQTVESPLFPNYLFVKIVNKWLSLQYTYGIASIISTGSLPAQVQDQVIDDLRSREVNGFIQLPKASKLSVGDVAVIKEGVFAGQSGLIERMSGGDRQKILLALLSNKIKVLVGSDELEAA